MARRRPYKFVFGENVIEFAGFEITPDSVRPCMKYLHAILDFPVTMNIIDVHSWFEVSYAFSLAEKMLPFRELLKPGIAFHWDENFNDVFEESKTTTIHEIENGVKTSTAASLHAFPLTCQKLALVYGYSRNTVTAKEQRTSAVVLDGKSLSLEVDSRFLLHL